MRLLGLVRNAKPGFIEDARVTQGVYAIEASTEFFDESLEMIGEPAEVTVAVTGPVHQWVTRMGRSRQPVVLPVSLGGLAEDTGAVEDAPREASIIEDDGTGVGVGVSDEDLHRYAVRLTVSARARTFSSLHELPPIINRMVEIATPETLSRSANVRFSSLAAAMICFIHG
jgi:hypothetical protein